jgi:RNA polymerase sigma factor (sigma-70 family)
MSEYLNELYSKIADEYPKLVLKWAYKKTSRNTEAEDLAQEVMFQVLRLVKKEVERGLEIEKLDHFIWKVAHYTWFNQIRKNAFHKSCMSLDAVAALAGRSVGEISDFQRRMEFAPTNEPDFHTDLSKVRLSISRLNYVHREVVIMRYIDGLSVKAIAEKLKITQENVMWHLHDARNKIRKEVKKMSNTNDVSYRPRKMDVAMAGSGEENIDVFHIGKSLTMQNICLECYESPKTIDELSDRLGLPKAYLEFDLKWLEENEFVKKEGSRYTTTFFIKTLDWELKITKFYLENKAIFLDKVVQKLIEKQDKIKAIGFYGSDAPIDRLLWFLIYTLVSKITYANPEDWDFPLRTDGGKYFPLGFERYKKDLIKQVLGYKYSELSDWFYHSEWEYATEDFSLVWRGLYKDDFSTSKSKIRKLFDRQNEEQRKLLVKVAQMSLRPVIASEAWQSQEDGNLIEDLKEDDKLLVSEWIENGVLKKTEDGMIVPNFIVFTFPQGEAYIKVLEEIAEELKPDIANFYENIDKFLKTNIPKHLKNIYSFMKHNIYYNSTQYITGFAYYDGLLYKPEDEGEYCLLTLQMGIPE